jgi:hypothetical protein
MTSRPPAADKSLYPTPTLDTMCHSLLRSSSGNVAKFSLRDRERQRENQSLDPRIV